MSFNIVMCNMSHFQRKSELQHGIKYFLLKYKVQLFCEIHSEVSTLSPTPIGQYFHTTIGNSRVNSLYCQNSNLKFFLSFSCCHKEQVNQLGPI